MQLTRRNPISFYSSLLLLTLVAASCSTQHKLGKAAKTKVFDSPALSTAHVGISIYDADAKKELYQYQADKYFVPASNTKIPTCYVAMKYLGDSIPGLRYEVRDDFLQIQFTGDPVFLHPDFSQQRVGDFLVNNRHRTIHYNAPDAVVPFGNGWAWNDYDQDYMPERSAFPIYGNVARFTKTKPGGGETVLVSDSVGVKIVPAYFNKGIVVNKTGETGTKGLQVERSVTGNDFVIRPGSRSSVAVPFTVKEGLWEELVDDTLGIIIHRTDSQERKLPGIIYSIPTDSLLKTMMHRSDNFFAEQSLLMSAFEFTGKMDENVMIDTVLKTDFALLPQKPRWADGSGLSRYNLFSPSDFVFILEKMRAEFGMARLKEIFPTGGEGTLSNYYTDAKDFIYAKTGSLSGVICISGYLETRKGRYLSFSVLVNNHRAAAAEVRRAVESFIGEIRRKY